MKHRFDLALLLTLLPLITRADVTIMNDPQPVAIVSGDRATFSVLASGSGSLSYQWQKNGADIAGATASALVLDPVTLNDAGDYSVRLNDATPGTRTSEIATLSVRPPADGDVDFSFGGSPGVIGTPTALSVQSDGRVLVCNVEAVGSVKCGNVVRLNGDGSIDPTFCNVPAEIEGSKCLVQLGDGRVFVAGSRWGIRANGLQGIARLNRDGSADRSFASGLAGVDGDVNAAVLQADGKIIIGGAFTTVHGVLCGHVARLNSDGTLDTSFCNGLAGTDQEVNAMALQADGKMVIGGSFTAVHGVGRAHIARLNSDGTLDLGFASTSTGPNGTVNTLLVQSNGKIVIGGMFSSVDGITRSGIARLESGGALDRNFAPVVTSELVPGMLVAGYVSALAQAGGDDIVIAGTFGYVNGVPRAGCARLNGNGTLDEARFDKGPDYSIIALAVQDDGKVLTGGLHWSNFGYLSRRNADGKPDAAFAPDPPVESGHRLIEDFSVNDIALLADGRLLTAGEVTGVTRLNADGRVDPSFATGLAGPDGAVRALAMHPDGRVLIGGAFTTVHGVARRAVARLNADGTLDPSFADPAVAGYSATVKAMAVQDDGKIIIAGPFLSVGGVARGRIARLNSNGTLDVGFGDGLAGFDGEVYSLVLQPDGKVIVGGYFRTINGIQRDNLVRLNTDGSLDAAFGPGFGTNVLGWTNGTGVFDVKVQADGKILVGGAI